MIKIVDKPFIKFGKIVKETTENILLEYSFAFCDDLPCEPEEDDNVIYSRIRNGIEEQIKFFRRNYSNEYDKDVIDEVEAKRLYLDGKDSEFYDENQFYWISRHWFEVLLIVNYGHRDLLPTGKAGIGRNGEEFWYFEDEEDLRKLLEEKIIPLMTTVVMKDFDEQLQDELEYSAKKNKQTNQETDWQSDSGQTAIKA
jgi:hypothetical protein